MNTRERSVVTFTVASYEATFTGELSLFALFNRFQDLAEIHAAHLQVGYDLLQESKLVWILSRIRVRILSLPSWGDTVELATWPKGIDRLFALRDFSVKDEKGAPLVLATSAWLLVDMQKNRPQRIESLPIDLRYPGAPHAVPETPDKIPVPERLVPVCERPVWLSDIDINQHVNNAQYAKWVCDCFPEDHYRRRRMTSMQINYLEETRLGDTVELLKAPEDDRTEDCFIGGKSRKKGSMVFHAQATWT